jgi:hypothetical protein
MDKFDCPEERMCCLNADRADIVEAGPLGYAGVKAEAA